MASSIVEAMMRPTLPEAEIERIRRARYKPLPTQHDYLHLRGLLGKLREVVGEIDVADGPVLDLYCGTQPYRDVFPWRPLWGLDIDNHFGRADIVAHEALPFRDGDFNLVVCIQALCVVNDPQRTVNEMLRLVVPGGYVVATVARIFHKELPHQRKFSNETLRALFGSPWEHVRVDGIGGPGAGLALIAGSLLAGAARRSRLARILMPPIMLAFNGLGATVDFFLGRLKRRWPASLMVVARRPVG